MAETVYDLLLEMDEGTRRIRLTEAEAHVLAHGTWTLRKLTPEDQAKEKTR